MNHLELYLYFPEPRMLALQKHLENEDATVSEKLCDRFMELCKSKQIQNCCHPNAIMTLKEYLVDYASPKTKKIGEELIKREINTVPKEKVRQIVEDNLGKIEHGSRDFRF